MTKKEYNELLVAEVYKDAERPYGIKKILLRLYTRWLNPSRRAVYLVRKMQYYHQKGGLWSLYSDIIKRRIWKEFGSYISDNAVIGKGFHLPHPTGVIIGVASVLGENVSVYQGVTIGGGRTGDAKKGNQPIIGNNVTIFAGCKVLGKIKVGDNVVVAAGCVLIKDAEANGVYAGVPGCRVK